MSWQDQLAADAFLKCLENQKLVDEVMKTDPCSLVDATQLQGYCGATGRLEGQSKACVLYLYVDVDDDAAPLSCRIESPTYVTADQFKGFMEKVELMQMTLSRLQPVMNDQREQRYSKHPLGREHSPSLDLGSSPHKSEISAHRAAKGPCYHCDEGHFRRECSRSPSPASLHKTGGE